MAYNTNTYFMIFLPLVLIAYQLTPQKHRWKTLLAASAAFFWMLSSWLIAWCALTTTSVWYFGKRVGKLMQEKGELPRTEKEKKKQLDKIAGRWCAAGIILPVVVLAVLKYTGFTLDTFHLITGLKTPQIKWAVPIGISFYTLQAVGYMLDVLWGRIEHEENWAKLALFLTFFPTLMEGPILTYEEARTQIFVGNPITGDSFLAGSMRILWGLFKRMLIADRLNATVNLVYKDNANFYGSYVWLIAIVTTVQLYLEFSGTIDICIGSAQLFDITLPENFKQPFFATDAAIFWRRWHISLGRWLKNYVFYPVSTSGVMKKWGKFGRKHCGKYWTNSVSSLIALAPVWLLNGLWHGPHGTYIMYGVFYLIILQAEVMLKPGVDLFLSKVHLTRENWGVKLFCMAKTWIIVLIGELEFRANTWGWFTRHMGNMFKKSDYVEGWIEFMLDHGLNVGDLVVVIAGCVVVLIVDLKLEKHPDMFRETPKLSAVKRYGLCYAMIMAIVILGAYGAGYKPAELIYAGF